MVRVMIVDDHALIRRIVRQVVENENDLEMVAEACNGYEAETQAAQTQPDVVLMDRDMPKCDGIEATERVLSCSPHSRIVILTAVHGEQQAFRAIQCGAVGYLTKDIEPDTLVHAIRSAARDELYIADPLASYILAHIRSLHLSASADAGYRQMAIVGRQMRLGRQESRPGLRRSVLVGMEQSQQATTTHPLTEREQQILALVRKGHKNREIAGALCVAESTVHKHVQNILEKLHARNRTEAIYLTSLTQTAS